MRRSTLILAALFASGCVGDLVELTPPGAADLAGAVVNADLAGPGNNNPDGGGTPQSVHFTPDIQTDIHNLGCAAAACHGGTQVPQLKDPAADTATQMANYTNFTAEANQGANSPVLSENLAGNGVTHSGGKAFASASDPVYVRWLAWINAGNPP